MPLVSPRFRSLRLVVLGLALGGAPLPGLAAQAAPAAGRVLTLDEALGLARQNNPALQSARNARRTFAASVSTTASWKPRAMDGASASSASRATAACTASRTAVLRPLNDRSK